MKNIKFVRQPGFIFDLFFLFTLHFNKEYCLTNFINYSKSSEDTGYYKSVLNDFPPISDELSLFFHLTEDKKNFMTKFFFEPYKEQFSSESYNISVVQDALSDHDRVLENLIKFYFKDIDADTLLECKSSISAINKLIKESNYNGDIKSALYSFFIDPTPVMRRLSYELMEKEFALMQRYDNNAKRLSDLRDDFDFELLCQGLKNGKQQKGDLSSFENIYISFCLLHKNCIKSLYRNDGAVVLLGSDHLDTMEYLVVQNELPELDAFGNAISEPNRVSVLDLIAERGEITIKDLEQEFGFTGTNAYYHLSLMIKAGMLKTRNRGRTVLYSINKNYFQVLCDILGKYYKS